MVGKPREQCELLQTDSNGILVRRQILPDVSRALSTIRVDSAGNVVVVRALFNYTSELYQYTSTGLPAGRLVVSDYLIDAAPASGAWIAAGYEGLYRIDFTTSSTQKIAAKQLRWPTYLLPITPKQFVLVDIQNGLLSRVLAADVTTIGPVEQPNVPEMRERTPVDIQDGTAAFLYSAAADEQGTIYVTVPNMTTRPYIRILAIGRQGPVRRIRVTLPPATLPNQHHSHPNKMAVSGTNLYVDLLRENRIAHFYF